MSSNQVIIIWLAASLLVVASQVEAQCFDSYSLFTYRDAPKLRFPNTPCRDDNNELGKCLTHDDCERKGGTHNGSCRNGVGVCCSFKFTCGGTTSQNETIFVNPQYPIGENGTYTCQVTIERAPNVCQLRLDFDEFELAHPDENGLCTTDSLFVRTTVGERLPILCGDNAKQHIYVGIGRESDIVAILAIVTNGESMLRKWKIKIKMIPCDSIDMAPSGCLQYYRSPSAVIRSFNYGARVEGLTRYMSNLRYTACVRLEENFYAIKWETEQPNSFSFGSPFDRNVTELGGSAGGLCNNDDFIGVDQGSSDGVGPGEDRFCGGRLLDSNIIISRSKPIYLKVRSNYDQTQNNLNSQIGFSLRYTQLFCVR